MISQDDFYPSKPGYISLQQVHIPCHLASYHDHFMKVSSSRKNCKNWGYRCLDKRYKNL